MQGINLGQGISGLSVDEVIKEAAYTAMQENHNSYSACEGVIELRIAVSQKIQSYNGVFYDPNHEIVITHGSTGAFVCACKTLFNPGDEVIIFEPFYSYHQSILKLFNVTIKTIAINLDDLSIDLLTLPKLITSKTKGIVICNPNNPSGKVYSKEELTKIGKIASDHNLYIISDEIYEFITYPNFPHISMASLTEFRDRTLVISGFSKTFNMTGWRLGYIVGPAAILQTIALVQDLLYVCPSTEHTVGRQEKVSAGRRSG